MPYHSRRAVHKDINLRAYGRVIHEARRQGYAVIPFDAADRHERFLILRHDIDLDPACSLELATLEKKLGVRSTYFVMLHNPVYNTWSARCRELFRTIWKMGHAIGLHFDNAYYGHPHGTRMLRRIDAEVEALAEILGLPIRFVSFHQPRPEILGARIGRPGRYESVYSPRFFTAIRYIADSAGRWREESVLDLIRKGTTPRIQFLSHAEIWCAPGRLLQTRIERVRRARGARLADEFREAINSYVRREILYE